MLQYSIVKRVTYMINLSQCHNTVLSYNLYIVDPKRPVLTLRTPFDIVFSAFLTLVLTQNVLRENHMFYNIGHISGPRRSTDLIFSAFDVKFHA